MPLNVIGRRQPLINEWLIFFFFFWVICEMSICKLYVVKFVVSLYVVKNISTNPPHHPTTTTTHYITWYSNHKINPKSIENQIKNQSKLINGKPKIKHSMENSSTQTQNQTQTQIQIVTIAKYVVVIALNDHFKEEITYPVRNKEV